MEDENAPAPDTEVAEVEVEGDETPAVETPASVPEGEGNPADVLSTFSQQEWAQELVRDQEENAPYAIGQADIDALPIEAKRVLAALAFRGKQAEAQLNEALENIKVQTAAAEERERGALQIQADALKWVNSPGVAEFMQKTKPKGDQPDIDTPEGVQWLIEDQVSKRLGEFFDAIKSGSEAQEKAANDAKTAAAKTARQAEISDFMVKYADDFANPEIYQRIHKLAKSGVRVEEAHELVTGAAIAKDLRTSKNPALEEARARVVKGGAVERRIPELPKEIRGDTELETAWYDAHPDALKRDLERHERGTRR